MKIHVALAPDIDRTCAEWQEIMLERWARLYAPGQDAEARFQRQERLERNRRLALESGLHGGPQAQTLAQGIYGLGGQRVNS